MTATGGRKTTTAEAERGRTGLFGRLGPGAYGPLPVLIGLAAIWTIFTVANPRFLSPVNLTNMMLQIAAVGTISVGIVLVLLLGEIDLSVGSVSGFAAGVMAVLSVKAGLPAVPAILCGILVGLVIGAFNGLVVTRFGVHSLVVTLAGLLGFQGALLYVLGDTGTINLRDPIITGLAGTFFPPLVGWVAAAAVIAAYAAAVFSGRRRELAAGLERPLAPVVAVSYTHLGHPARGGGRPGGGAQGGHGRPAHPGGDGAALRLGGGGEDARLRPRRTHEHAGRCGARSLGDARAPRG